MNEKLALVQLHCGHIVRFRGFSTVPAIGEEITCTMCPMVNDHYQTQVVRDSPKSDTSLSCLCQDCSWKRQQNHGNIYLAIDVATNHAKRHSHLVRITKNRQLHKEINYRQDRIATIGGF